MIFIDSSFFIALANDKDQWHIQTPKVLSQIQNQEQITSLLTLSEAVTHIGSFKGGKNGKKLYDYITGTNKVIHPPEKLCSNAMAKYLMYDGTLSFADVLSLEIMEIHGIDSIVSFDSDFDKVKGIKRIH